MSIKTMSKRSLSPDLQKVRDKHREEVRGIFNFHEVPGGSMDFVFKEFDGDEVKRYTMMDGQIYTVPLGVAKHLNKDCWYPIHQHAVDANGATLVNIGQKIRRCSFSPLDFIADEDLIAPKKDLVTIEKFG
jgi:hypothetical protein